jgi:coenzyme F420 biosynthesis associated uncharacterized protein
VSRGLIDWALAKRVATAVGSARSDDRASPLAGPDPFGAAAIEAACAAATERVIAYTALRPATRPPRPELVDRAAWATNALALLSEVGGELDRRVGSGIELPGPLGDVARSVLGAALAAEAGAVAGYASRKVLGQYDISLVDPERPARLLFVPPNLREARRQLDADAGVFLDWIALHETTHTIQFGAVPWLREHVAGLIKSLVEGATEWLEDGGMRAAASRIASSDPRRIARAILRGELARALAGRGQTATLDRLQATMAVIEGHAEHVMDAAGDLGSEQPALRERLEARRAGRSGLDALFARLLGLELKLRQYRLGKAFCDTLVAESGVEGLNRVWHGPEALPDLAELERPREWLERIEAAPVPT